MDKSPEAFRTISEVAAWLDTPAHVLRFWESRFTQVKPVKRAGGRRYYRPADMMLLGGIKKLLHEDGLTIRGVQKILREEGVKFVAQFSPPLDEGPVIEGQAERLDDAALASLEAEEAPIHLDAEAEPDLAEVVALDRALRPEPDEAILPVPEPEPEPEPEDALSRALAGHGLASDEPEAKEAVSEPGPVPSEPEIADTPAPAFIRHRATMETMAAPSPAEPPPAPREPDLFSIAEETHPREPVSAAPEPETPPEPTWEAEAEPQPEPLAADESGPEPEQPSRPEPEPEPPQPLPRLLGIGLPRTDPADDDPAFAPTVPAIRTALRASGMRRALAADRERTADVVARLQTLSARLAQEAPQSGA